jgi:2,3-bisphosphoglycerate-independent phosphoglycerate mutase
MKYVIVRCEDHGPYGDATPSLLAGSKTPHLLQLAQAGAVGRLTFRNEPGAISRALCHRALFGLGPDDPDGAPGRSYAAGANLELAIDETAWCCELITQRDGRIVDPSAGRITPKESAILMQALDEALGSETRQWGSGRGRHHVLTVKDEALSGETPTAVEPPEMLVGHPWKRRLPKGRAGEALASLLEQALTVLDGHPVNRVRVDLGENPANMVWLWGPSGHGQSHTFAERTGMSGAVISGGYFLQGFARACNLGWQDAPAAEEAPLRATLKAIEQLLNKHNFIYVHLAVESADAVERFCAMERIDQFLLKPLTDLLPGRDEWRLLTAVDDWTTGSVPFIAIGSGLPKHPAASLDAASLAAGPLQFHNGQGIFEWFIQRV